MLAWGLQAKRRNRQGPFNSSSPLGPLRHQEKSESTKEETEEEEEKEEEEDGGLTPKSRPRVPGIVLVLPFAGCVSLSKSLTLSELPVLPPRSAPAL